MYDKSTARRKSPEIQELERLANIKAREDHREIDQRFESPHRYNDNTTSGLISCIIAYTFILGGRAERTKEFTGVTAQFRGYDLLIRVAAGQPGMPVFTEQREVISLTVHSFAQFKRIIDEL